MNKIILLFFMANSMQDQYEGTITHPCDSTFCEAPIPIRGAAKNKTDQRQKIGLGVYGIRKDNSRFLFSSSYMTLEPGETGQTFAQTPDCSYEAFLSSMTVPFKNKKVNATTDGYLIHSDSRVSVPCN